VNLLAKIDQISGNTEFFNTIGRKQKSQRERETQDELPDGRFGPKPIG